MLPDLKFKINSSTYLKDPESSDLGLRIISGSIEMIYEVGFECFTFRKLAGTIESTEASVYRYFESKHKLLLYLTCWYWEWMEYRLHFGTANISSPQERLSRALQFLTGPVEQDGKFAHVDEVKLNKIVIAEASKVYLVKEVDEVNREGVFSVYKRLVARISDIVMEINPDYKYPHMLISTVVEGSHYQRYFAEHLPSLTDILEGEDAISKFYHDMVFKSIAP
ncbi:MAG TPA: TetR family transcriptional regulator [Cryomorphaceae bacterium]|nr:TetR family transcriptional regulator [Owenweeksia sp.]MBF97489.1 TetR family transcriptional regulator [Owenweeksia sp.]HAD95918.1 TetR family transcriptional regulator [Cryomorphaceae bacterium]HBF19991.1 TetR family transcriptional regulator [Cryomorphaceae bacterium]